MFKPPVRRETYADSETLLPEMTMLGWDRVWRAGPNLCEHVHPNAWEICYIVRGEVRWWAENKTYQVGGGDIYLTRPNERHGGVDAMLHPCELFWLLVAIPEDQPLPGMTLNDTRGLLKSIGRVRARTFRGSDVIGECFERLVQEHRHRTALSAVAARAALHALLVQVIRDASVAEGAGDAPEGAGKPVSPKIRRALDWMAANLAEDYPIAAAADAAGLGVSQFHDRFVNEVGVTPNEYRMRQRIDRARVHLGDPSLSITAIAHRLGFSTSQYFATVFKNFCGMTPQQYRQGLGRPAADARVG